MEHNATEELHDSKLIAAAEQTMVKPLGKAINLPSRFVNAHSRKLTPMIVLFSFRVHWVRLFLALLFLGNFACAAHCQGSQIPPVRSNDALSYNHRGIAYKRIGDRVRALSDFNEAIRLKPDFSAAYFNRGNLYASKGDNAHAIADFTQAIHFTPDNADAYINRGELYSHERKYALAISDFNQAIRLKPDDGTAYHNRAMAYDGQDKYALAVNDFNQAIRLEPRNPEFYFSRAIVWFDTKQFDKAWADIKQGRALGGKPSPGFIKYLVKESGRQDPGK